MRDARKTPRRAETPAAGSNGQADLTTLGEQRPMAKPGLAGIVVGESPSMYYTLEVPSCYPEPGGNKI